MLITINGYMYNTRNITHATAYVGRIDIFPVDYHQVRLLEGDAERMVKALNATGFVGTETMVNPERVSVVDGVGETRKLWLEGADKVLFISSELAGEIEKALNGNIPARETASLFTTQTAKPRRKTKASE